MFTLGPGGGYVGASDCFAQLFYNWQGVLLACVHARTAQTMSTCFGLCFLSSNFVFSTCSSNRTCTLLEPPANLHTFYISQGLLETLRVPQSLGFLGGRPNHAIFFIGAQGMTQPFRPSNLLYTSGVDHETLGSMPSIVLENPHVCFVLCRWRILSALCGLFCVPCAIYGGGRCVEPQSIRRNAQPSIPYSQEDRYTIRVGRRSSA